MLRFLSRLVPRGSEHDSGRLFVALVLPVSLMSVGPARGDIIAPNVPIAGQSQLDHAHQWVNVMLNIPAANNPILDPTGAEAFRGQVGSVLYLAGSFGGSTNRSITVDGGTTLFFPLVNTWADNTTPFGDPPTTFTPQQLLDMFSIPPANIQNLFVTIDGVPVAGNFLNHRQTTDPNNPYGNVFQSANNLYTDFGYDATFGTGIYPSTVPTVVDGYWVGMTLPPGLHTISFGGDIVNHPVFGNTSQNNTFQIVATPEPATVFAWGAVIFAGVLAVRYRRVSREALAA